MTIDEMNQKVALLEQRLDEYMKQANFQAGIFQGRIAELQEQIALAEMATATPSKEKEPDDEPATKS